jgi:hypothetical protein
VTASGRLNAMRWGQRSLGEYVFVLALASALLIAGCGTEPSPSPSPSPKPVAIPEPLTHDLVDANVFVHGGGFVDFSDPTDCAGQGLLDDLHSGADVIVTDAAGVIVGTGTLSKGVAQEDPVGCRLWIRVDGLPESPSYTVKVGQRPPTSMSFEDMFRKWTYVIP